jgi:hypothetical protein
MKKVFFIATIISVFAVLTAFTTSNINSTKTEISLPSDYCDGWEDGYCEGWKDVKGSMALCPLTPLCPLPELGKDRYRDGYNRGFKAGFRAAQR